MQDALTVDEAAARLAAIVSTAQTDADALQALVDSARAQGEHVISIREEMETAQAAAKQHLDDISKHATSALTAKTRIEDDQAVIAAKSSHIHDAQQHADRVRAEIDGQNATVSQRLAEIESTKSSVEAMAATLSTLLAQSQSAKTTIDTEAAAVAESKVACETAAKAMQKLAAKSDQVFADLRTYETQLENLTKQCQERLVEIEGLLPGATSAGLAHAFDDRRQTFLKPGTRWQVAFIGSLVSIVVITGLGIWQSITTTHIPSYDELFRLWLSRFPVIGALVWLAVHSSRESALAKRLEEDYGYKAAIAASFQGFTKQMAQVSETNPDSPLSKLCSDTLATLAASPGRIYEKHALTSLPPSSLLDPSKSGTAGDG